MELWAYEPMVLPDGGQTRMGCGVFSRFDMAEGERIVLQEGLVVRGSVKRDGRVYVQGWVNFPSGSRVLVGSVHLPFHPRFWATEYKLRLVEQVLGRSGEGSYILAGDMNATPWSRAARWLRRELRHAGSPLRDATWTTRPFAIGPWRYEELKWRLDYVLYRGGLRPKAAQVVPTKLSDHLPILVEFEVGSAT